MWCSDLQRKSPDLDCVYEMWMKEEEMVMHSVMRTFSLYFGSFGIG